MSTPHLAISEIAFTACLIAWWTASLVVQIAPKLMRHIRRYDALWLLQSYRFFTADETRDYLIEFRECAPALSNVPWRQLDVARSRNWLSTFWSPNYLQQSHVQSLAERVWAHAEKNGSQTAARSRAAKQLAQICSEMLQSGQLLEVRIHTGNLLQRNPQMRLLLETVWDRSEL